MSEIDNYLQSELNLQNDTNYLIEYIKKNIIGEKIKEKEDFYSKMQLVFDRIFGVTKKTNIPFSSFSSQHMQRSLVELLNSDKCTFEDFDHIIHLFLPNRQIYNFFNLFYNSNYTGKEYLVEINNNHIFGNIDTLLKNNKLEYLLKNLSLISTCSKNPNTQLLNFKNGRLIFTCFEYFIMFLLLAMKESDNKSKIQLDTKNSNFNSLKSQKRFLSTKSPIIAGQIDLSRSLEFNFYNILFRSILRTIIKRNDKKSLSFITSMVEFVWLSDYFLLAPNYISNNSVSYNISNQFSLKTIKRLIQLC